MPRPDVVELIIRPMTRCFRRPAEPPDLEDYYQALECFPRQALHHAWATVRDNREYPTWPMPAEFVKAAKTSKLTDDPRKTEAMQMAEDYTTQFMKRRKVARVAKEEGWAGNLRRYVHASAWVQAQAIQGLDGISWDSGAIGDRDDLTAILKRKNVKDGKIDVTVPEDRQEGWRERAKEKAPMKPEVQAVLDRLAVHR